MEFNCLETLFRQNKTYRQVQVICELIHYFYEI